MGLDLGKLQKVQHKKEQKNEERERKLKEFYDSLSTNMSRFNKCHTQFVETMKTIPDKKLQSIIEKTIDFQNLDEYTTYIYIERPRIAYDREFRVSIKNTSCKVYCFDTVLTTVNFTDSEFFVARIFNDDADIKHCMFVQWLKTQNLMDYMLISDENKTYKFWTLYSNDVVQALVDRLTAFGLEIVKTDETWYDIGDKETDYTYLKIAVTFKNPLK